jgi:hypothetical protein
MLTITCVTVATSAYFVIERAILSVLFRKFYFRQHFNTICELFSDLLPLRHRKIRAEVEARGQSVGI